MIPNKAGRPRKLSTEKRVGRAEMKINELTWPD